MTLARGKLNIVKRMVGQVDFTLRLPDQVKASQKSTKIANISAKIANISAWASEFFIRASETEGVTFPQGK